MNAPGSGAFADARFAHGIQLFDAGAFFEAHEAWESLWREVLVGHERTVLQGLIQAAAAFHKLLVQGDRESAARILSRALPRLEAHREANVGFDLGAFAAALRDCHASVAQSDPGRFDRAKIPKLSARAARTS